MYSNQEPFHQPHFPPCLDPLHSLYSTSTTTTTTTTTHDLFGSPDLSSSPFLQRSSSTLSLEHNQRWQLEQTQRLQMEQNQMGSMRRVFSTGDLGGDQEGGVGGSGSGGGRVGRYTPEERRERIERYKSKRNHRNFQKKITYACRKTLADSRPRVRGRFARNGEAEAETDDGVGADEWCNWREPETNCMNNIGSSSTTMGETTTEEDYGYDELWGNFFGDFSISNLIS